MVMGYKFISVTARTLSSSFGGSNSSEGDCRRRSVSARLVHLPTNLGGVGPHFQWKVFVSFKVVVVPVQRGLFLYTNINKTIGGNELHVGGLELNLKFKGSRKQL